MGADSFTSEIRYTISEPSQPGRDTALGHSSLFLPLIGSAAKMEDVESLQRRIRDDTPRACCWLW